MPTLTKPPKDLSIGFIGAGMMSTAMMDGMIAGGVVPSPDFVACSDRNQSALDAATEKGIFATKSNVEVCWKAKDVVIIAVKPNVVEQVCKDIISVDSKALVLSVAAGVTIATLEENMPGRRVVRVMPNTPCLVGEAACGFSLGKLCTDSDRAIVNRCLGAIGIACELKEPLLNAVTGVSGSGPAYVFEFIEALSDGGVRAGLPRDVALQLAAQTVKGAAEMVLKTNTHPAVLKDRVTSPGGTTIAGLDALEAGGMRTAAINAVKAATRRSFQLGGTPEDEIINTYNL